MSKEKTSFMRRTAHDVDMIDLYNAEIVEIKVDRAGKTWINVDGKCLLRIGYSPRIISEFPNGINHSFEG